MKEAPSIGTLRPPWAVSLQKEVNQTNSIGIDMALGCHQYPEKMGDLQMIHFSGVGNGHHRLIGSGMNESIAST